MKMDVKSGDKVLQLNGHEDLLIVLVEKAMADHQDRAVKSATGVAVLDIGQGIAPNQNVIDITHVQDIVRGQDRGHDLIGVDVVSQEVDLEAEIENVAGGVPLIIDRRAEV